MKSALMRLDGMLLEDIKKLTEAKYSSREYYVVRAVDVDGDMGLYAGPFNDKEAAKKFQQVAHATTEKQFDSMSENDEYRQWLPEYSIEKITHPQAFLQDMSEHIEQMLS